MLNLENKNNIDCKNKIYLCGMKPSKIHLGHILTIFKDIELISKTNTVYFLIANYNKYESSLDLNLFFNLEVKLKQIFNKNKNIYIYSQSDFKEIYCDLFFLISSYISFKDLDKIYKLNYFDKHKDKKTNIVSYYYPIIMLIDILLISPCNVLVSNDQLHNVRFVNKFINFINKKSNNKTLFNINFTINKNKIISLLDENKMSTSNDIGSIFISDSEEIIYEKILKANTQSNMPQNINDFNVNTLNLYLIYKKLNNITLENIIEKYKNKNFINFKKNLSLSIINLFKKYNQEIKKESFLQEKNLFNNFNCSNQLNNNKFLSKLIKNNFINLINVLHS